ncbi:MAG: DUF1573 domain-containing protein [Bdellovibrionales bacterium]|nr:DUF1573 domain-containing protein [Bdellovibrionales bacterium]
MTKRLRLPVLIKLLAGIALFLAVVPLQAAAEMQPKMKLASTVHKFGTVLQGTRVQYSFVVRNEGSAPLEINRVQPECGCTAAVPEENPVAPGESTRITATFDTTGFNGYKVKAIRIYTNDPEQPTALLTFQGTVDAEVSIDPPRLYFGTVHKGGSASKEFVINLNQRANVKIKDVLSRSESVKLEKIDESHMRASLKTDIAPGVFRSRIVVRTSSAANPIVNIPVFARIEGDLKLVPADVSFGLLKGPLQSAVTRKVRLVSSAEKPVKVLSVKSSSNAVSAVIDKAEGNEYQIEIGVRRGTSGPFRGEVTITTDHPDKEQQVVILPVYGIVGRQGA